MTAPHRLYRILVDDPPVESQGLRNNLACALGDGWRGLRLRGVGVLLEPDVALAADPPDWIRPVVCAFDAARPCSVRCAAMHAPPISDDYQCLRLNDRLIARGVIGAYTGGGKDLNDGRPR